MTAAKLRTNDGSVNFLMDAAYLRSIDDLDVLTQEIGRYFTDFTGIKQISCECMHAKRFNISGKEHSPTRLMSDEQGVYVFIVDAKHCLKVGCTVESVRWSSQHYTLDLNRKSTLPISVWRDLQGFKRFLADTEIADEAKDFAGVIQDAGASSSPSAYSTMIREWLEKYTSRMEFKIPYVGSDSRFAGKFLESTLHFVLYPLFEG